MKYKSPLSIYVLWHPDFESGERFANEVFSTFCRDIKHPFSRGIGVPVFFRSEFTEGTNRPLAIPYKESDKNAVVLLIDDKMFESDDWRTYVREIAIEIPVNTRVFPVAMSQYSYFIDEIGLSKNQFIRAEEIIGTDESDKFINQWDMIRRRLLHDVSRQLLNLSTYSEAIKTDDPPVKLFLSHAKKDGESLATKFRDYVRSNTKLNTFFDANDIADGHNFETQIKDNAENSALIVFQSDEYSNREWCRIEIITAKRFFAPIVLVHDIKKGERRSFPYMGNSPSIKWDNNIDEIIEQTLIQVLNKYFNESKLRKEIIQYGLEDSYSCLLLPKPPELFNYIDIERMKKANRENEKPYLVLYPDPPLGYEELRLLNDVDEKIEFITPILLPSYLK